MCSLRAVAIPTCRPARNIFGITRVCMDELALSVKAVARDLLVEVGLGDRGDALVSTYSRGMRQRLGIARSLVNDPAVVFLDEPTLGPDPAGQRDVLEMIRRISRERGTTVFVSTHLLGEVEEVCSRVIILNRGRVVADGPVADVAGRVAASRSARVRVARNECARALAVLLNMPLVASAEVAPHETGEIVVTLASDVDVGRSLGRRPAGTAWRRGSDHRLRTRKRPPE